MGRLVYLDNAATTKTSPEVVKAMLRISVKTTEIQAAFIQLAAKRKQLSRQPERRSPHRSERSRRKFILRQAVRRRITGQ